MTGNTAPTAGSAMAPVAVPPVAYDSPKLIRLGSLRDLTEMPPPKNSVHIDSTTQGS
jgi:hypothetical protein